jgi:hypothetical protein
MMSLERDLLRIQTSVTESYQDMGNTWGSGAGRTTAIVIPREVPQAPSRATVLKVKKERQRVRGTRAFGRGPWRW